MFSIRKGQPETKLSESEFKRRYMDHFYDPNFDSARAEAEKLAEIAWKNYDEGRKAPRTMKAGAVAEGPALQDPDYDLSVEWVQARKALLAAEESRKTAKSRVLLISGSPRNEHTCAGEMPKTLRLVEIAKNAILSSSDFEVDVLDLSVLTAEFGKVIHPCKSCVSTAMPLCHWPCSCYPNHSLGQSPDWMNEIYERWVKAHGVMIVTPVHWYQAPSVLKLMVDRLVCADGGNPDPTTTHGKKAEEAKRIELAGWDYPKHLAGRAFSVVVHGDAAGVENLRRSLSDWLRDMKLVPAGISAELGQYIGYYKPYATSHEELDQNIDIQTETKNAALSLARKITEIRSGVAEPDEGLRAPNQK